MLTKLNVECINIGVRVDHRIPALDETVDRSIIDKNKNEYRDDFEGLEWSAHARNIINLKDSKYGIDGYYFLDTTWDNDMKNDSYTFFLMNSEKYTDIKNSYLNREYPGAVELLESKSKEDFINRIKIINEDNSELISDDMFLSLISYLKYLDNNLFNNICNKYSINPDILKIIYDIECEIHVFNPQTEIYDYDWDDSCLFNEKTRKELTEYLSETITSKNNNKIKLENKYELFLNYYKNKYGSEYQEKFSEMLEFNSKRHYLGFGKKKNLNQNGEYDKTEIDVDNEFKTLIEMNKKMISTGLNDNLDSFINNEVIYEQLSSNQK